MMFQTFKKLYQVNLSTPRGIYRLLSSLVGTGANLMALLQFAARSYPTQTAIIDDCQEINYQDLYLETQQLAFHLQQKYGIQANTCVAILCRNHSPLVKTLFALSSVGAHAYLFNTEIHTQQLNQLLETQAIDVLIHDIEVWELVQASNFDKTSLLARHLTFDSVEKLSQQKCPPNTKVKKTKAGKLIILSSGTTGHFKTAVRKPSIFHFLNPFFALLTQLNLGSYSSTYIAIPIYHGFGMAALLVSITLGVKIVLRTNFDLIQAGNLLTQHKIQVLILVPTILNRLLDLETSFLQNTRLIISGGAALAPSLVQQTFQKINTDLANLYGTSEAGFCLMANSKDLQKYPNSLGKKVHGATLKIVNEQQKEVTLGQVGELMVNSSWIMKNSQSNWIKTGDLVYCNAEGYYFLCGRIDDRIVSGGENVYPIELEHILLQHPAIHLAAVVGIADPDFGQALKAFVQVKPSCSLNKTNLLAWLKPKTARYQMPKELVFINSMPLNALGKIDKNKLY